MGVLYTNNASTTLAAGLNDSATSTTVASSSGFPTISGSNYFYATLELADGSAHEIVKVTAISGVTWTIVRAQDSTSARAFSSSDKVELRINSALLTDVVNDALASTFTRQAFTGDGSDTTFTLSRTVNSENDLLVFIEGVFQPHSTYSLSGTTLTFSEAPANSREITVYHVSAAVSGDSLSLNNFSGNGSTTAFTMSVNPVHENNTMVFIDGVYQEKSTYATSGTTLTFDAAPANGTSIDVTTHTQSLINVPVDASVTLAKMAANSVDSDQYVDGSIDTAHIAASQITVAKMAANSVDSDQYVDGSIDTAHIADSQITVAKMAANSVDSDQYVDGSIDTAHYADNSITGAELADNIAIAGTLDVAGAVVFNEGSADVDFRVESNGNANMLFVDGGNNRVGIGTGSPDHALVVRRTDGDSKVLELSTADSTATMNFSRDGNPTAFIKMFEDGSTGTGALLFGTGSSASPAERMRIDSVGNVGIGASPVASASAYNSAALHLHQASGGSTGSQIHLTNAATGGAAGDGSFIAQWSDQHLYITNQESKDIAFSAGGSERMRIDANGHITAPHQSAFSVKKNAEQTNLSAGSDHTITWQTEIFDQNADFASNTFTAPVTGRYQFNVYMRLQSIDTAAAYYQCYIKTSNRNYEIDLLDPTEFNGDLNYYTVKGSILADMDASDIAYVTIRQEAGAAQTDTSYDGDTHFSGYLVC